MSERQGVGRHSCNCSSMQLTQRIMRVSSLVSSPALVLLTISTISTVVNGFLISHPSTTITTPTSTTTLFSLPDDAKWASHRQSTDINFGTKGGLGPADSSSDHQSTNTQELKRNEQQYNLLSNTQRTAAWMDAHEFTKKPPKQTSHTPVTFPQVGTHYFFIKQAIR